MRVFVAAEFSGQLVDGVVDLPHRAFLELLEAFLLKKNHHVFLAHEREEWGKRLMLPVVCTPLDYDGVRNADVVLAIIGKKVSGGVCIELGWASALGKRIILLVQEATEKGISPLMIGLKTVADVTTIFLKSNTYDMFQELHLAICHPQTKGFKGSSESHEDVLAIMERVVHILNRISKSCIPEKHYNFGYRLREDLGLDSMALLELIAALESEFNVDLKNSELSVSDFDTLGSVVGVIIKRIGGGHKD